MSRQIQNLETDEVFAVLGSRPEGLSGPEVGERRREVGANTLEARRRLWWLASLARQFTNFFTLLLLVAAAICFVADTLQPGERMDLLGWALSGVAILNALFSFVQEFRAERAMEELRKFLPQRVTVRRGGAEAEIRADELVPGDVLLVREGDRVPADARLVEAHQLLVNNAPLTGESRPVARVDAAVDQRLAESANLLFAGCEVLRGSGVAVVFATGLRTEFGKIATLSHEVRRVPSPLERQTARMVRILTVIATVMGLAFFAFGVLSGRPLWVNLVFMMGIIVANVPEGLLPTFTLSLAVASLRMARRNVLVKSLNAVEALGAVHVICTDKTGTLTLNRLAVSRIVGTDGNDDVGTDGTDDGADDGARTDFLACALIASAVDATANGFSGDPLDVAVAEALAEAGGSVDAIASRRLRAFAFDAEKRRSAGLAAADDGDGALFAVKGAWEALRPMISHREGADGAPIAADDEGLAAADAAVHRLASQGHRVIAVACRRLAQAPPEDAGQDDLERDLVLKGFLGLEDPIRAEVPDAVARCRSAGIRVLMVTGDHPDTARAVARRIGLLGREAPPGASCLTGDELARLRERDLVERLRQGACVFARTTPEQKMKIVAALHELDLVVAVTGDGVNDAPALRAADVGIAMGVGGTDVAREAAQVILLDDNFASIVAGVEQGRTIFANIRKFTNYVLVSNGPEILPFLLYMLLPVPLALTVIQILSIDLGTDIVPSMALGQEPPEPDTMDRPPRDRDQALLDWPLIAHSYLFLGLIEAAFALSLFFWVLVDGGWSWGRELAAGDPLYRSATGITLAAIVLMQIGNLFGRRSRYGSGLDAGALRNPLLIAGVGFEIAFSWAILYFPPVAAVLGTGPVAIEVYAAAWAGPPLIFLLDDLRKRIAVARAARAGATDR
ncbi:MAG: cation-translocating P-type ATPase [Rhodospirillales bacterium]